MVDNILNFYTDSEAVIREKWKKYGDDCEVFVRHYSSTIDSEAYVKEHGLLSLVTLLSNNLSPLYLFLEERGVSIDFVNQSIS